jgi:poly(A) polymerase
MDEKAVPFIVIPRQDHAISRDFIDPDVLKVLYRLQNHGFLAYLVGGCVRDLLLGKDPKDFDVATDAHPQQIRELFRNSRLIGRRFRLAHVYFRGGKFIEVSTFRRRSEFEETSLEDPSQGDNTFGTPAEDAFRRDITINGIFYNIADFSLIDYVEGLVDLRRGVIRCIGDPEEKFVQDPVRMLRVIRHAARTGFTIEGATYQSLLRHVEKIHLCSPARVRDEFLRELREGSAKASLELMIAVGMVYALFPPLRLGLRPAERKDHLLKIAEVLDELSTENQALSDASYLAAFLLPVVDAFCPPGDFPSNRGGQAAYQAKIRDWVQAVLTPLQFTAHAKEGAAHFLGAQKIFCEFRPTGKLPWWFTRRSYFSQAQKIFEIGARARGENLEGFSFEAEERKIFRRRKRKRHKRKPAPTLSDVPLLRIAN